MRRALIVGHTGQDGRILWDQLAAKGFVLVGISRNEVREHKSQWADAIDIANPDSVRNLVDRFRPDQIYYLAAYHHSSQDRAVQESRLWQGSLSVHVQSFLNFLDAIRQCHPAARIFYAGSSRVFGETPASPQTESTPFRPTCLYGITKASGIMLADYYRRAYNIHASCGILFNHESPLRGQQFVSQRVAHGLVAIKTGRARHLEVGDLNARIDWGYAPDYTRAMQSILEAETASDFVVATGETHSVREMIEIAAEFLNISWEECVVENLKILQRNSQQLCGDSTHLRRTTGWRPSVSFRDLVQIMVKAALASAAQAIPASASTVQGDR